MSCVTDNAEDKENFKIKDLINMSCRIIFEDEIGDQNLNNTNLNEELIIKEEVEDNCSQDHTQEKENLDCTDTNSDTECSIKESEQLQSVTQLDPPKPLINQDHFDLFHGCIHSPIQSISIVEVGQKESIAVKEKLQAVCEGIDDIIVPNEEHSSDDDAFGDRKPVNLYDNYLDIEDIQLQSHHLSDSEDDVPLMELETQAVEVQEVSENKRKAKKTNSLEAKNLYNNYLDIYIPPHHSELDSEDGVPLMKFKTEPEEEQEVSENKRKAKKTNRAHVTKQPELDTRGTKQEDTITAEQTKTDPKITQNTQNRITDTNLTLQKSVNNTVVDTNCHSNQDFKPFKCDTYRHSFTQKINLRSHSRIQTGEKPFKCDICQRSFTQKGHLTKHIRTHTGEKPFKCDICQRSFAQKINLSSHSRIHTGEKPFKCDICQRSFTQKGHLGIHIRTHTGEKPFKCDICQRSFTQKISLRCHSRIHTGEKPFKCHVCQRSFKLNGALKSHIQIHTGEKPFKCDICQRSFRRRNDLTNHTTNRVCRR